MYFITTTLVHDLMIVVGMTVIGLWLEGVGKIIDRWDELLTPLPLIAVGLVIIAGERTMG